MRSALVLVAVGCTAPAATPVTATRAASVAIAPTYCPSTELGPWAHEVFPACPPFPYEWSVAWCQGGGCGRPCAVEGGGFGGHMGGTTDEFSPMTFEYDARGRWISETRDGKVVARCTYRGDTEVLDHCELSWSLNVVRDSRGRIAAVITRGGERRDEVAWDVAGRVVAIGRHAYDYDAQGRMRSDRGLVLEYDARNRVTRKTFPGADETDAIVYTYDGDHLVRVKGPKYDNLSIAYDARGRVHEAERSGLETSHVRTYDYDCR